jgi:hypothetical protein
MSGWEWSVGGREEEGEERGKEVEIGWGKGLVCMVLCCIHFIFCIHQEDSDETLPPSAT